MREGKGVTGACLLPAMAPQRMVFSGELYIPNTSANASFVANVTVGSTYGLFETVAARLLPGRPSVDVEGSGRGGGGGAHFLPSRPMDRARASCILYSMPSSVNNRFMLNRSFSGRFPGAGGASMRAYLSAAVELKTPGEGAGGGRA